MEGSGPEGGIIEFRTLGGASLTFGVGPEAHTVRLPPKPLALLAYLAVECPLGHRRRDELVGLLWPDMPDHRARAGLSQALYRLRQDLDPRAVVTHGQEVVCVDENVLWCDAVAFRSAMDGGRSRDALDLYRGPFLRGFHLSDPGEFEEWLSQIRKRLHETAAEAARDLAREREEAGDLDEAVRFATQALELNPYDETALRHLIRVFDCNGERPLALHAYERFATRLRAEMDADPSPETFELIERVKLRTERDPRTPDPGVAPAPATRLAGSSGPPETQPKEGNAEPLRRLRGNRLWPALAGTAVLAVAALVYGGRDFEPLPPDYVLVGNVDNRTGDSSLDRVSTAMAEGILQSLSLLDFVTPVMPPSSDTLAGGGGPERLETTDASLRELARSSGAGTLVVSSLDSAGDSLSLVSQIVDVESGEILRGIRVNAASPTSIGGALEDLVERVAWVVSGRMDPRFEGAERWGDRKPRLEAYLQFVEGVDVYLGSAGFRQPEGAIENFDRASRLDSTFYAPRIWMVIAHSYMGNTRQADSMAAELQNISDQLSLTDRYVLDSWTATRNGQPERALSVIERAMILAPEAEYMPLAVLAALNAGHYREGVRWMTEADTARGWAAYWGAYSMSLAAGYHQLGMHELELEPARRTARGAPANRFLQMPEVRALAELGDPELEERLEEILARADPPYWRGEALCSAAAESMGHGHAETGAALLDRCIQWDEEHLEVGGDATRIRLGQSLVLAGRLPEARRHLELLAETRADNPYVMGPLGVLEALEGNTEEARRIMAHLDEIDPPPPAWEQRKIYWQAAIAAHTGLLDEAVRLLRKLADAGGGKPDPQDLFLKPLWDHPLFGQLTEITG